MFGDELEHKDRDERLGDAAGTEPINGPEWNAAPKHSDTGHRSSPVRAIIDEHERTRTSRRNHRIKQRLRRILWPTSRAHYRHNRTANSHRDQPQRCDS